MYSAAEIKLSDKVPGCPSFKWSELLFLPKWDIFCYPSIEQAENLMHICQKLQIIRDMLSKPISITSALRPSNYNAWSDPYGVGGAKKSAHTLGKAIDFIVIGMSSNDARAWLIPDLEKLEIRVENLPNSSWVHIDASDVGPSGNRYFLP